jgi:hypothetical protein
MTALQPNKWILHLGINDNGGSAGFQSNMQSIIDALVDDYGATGSNIYLAVPSYRTNWQPYINNLISINSLSAGPDFNTFYTNNTSPTLYVGVHPNVAGHVEMGRLWGISIISPKNFSAVQSSANINLTWDDLSIIEPSISGYKIYYGTNPASLSTVVDVGDVTSHSITSGLSAGQTYYFAIRGYDDDAFSLNHTARSGVESVAYTTPDVTAPVISNISASPTDTSVVITFDTDEASDTQVEYGTTVSYGSTTTLDTSMVTSHSDSISGLTASTTYHYRIITTDASNNTRTSSDQTFTTDATPDVTAPVISNISASPSLTSATITFDTDEASDTQIEYGTSISYGSSTTLDASLVTSHSVALLGLSPSTIYHYRIITADASSNTQTSSDQTFTTDADTTPGPDSESSSPTYSSYSKTSRNIRNTKNTNTQTISIFTRNLRVSDSGEDVRRLQDFLIKKKLLLIDKSTGYFGPLTFKALVNYQKSAGITPTSGFFGPITRGVVSEVLKTMK